MSESEIRWEPYGSMHFGYLEPDKIGYIVQGPMKGMYALYKYAPIDTLKIEEFPDPESAKLAAEKMEESKC